jgi:hypothetical protein
MIHLGLQFSWISLFRAKVLGQERRMAMRSSTLAFEELQEHIIVLSFTQELQEPAIMLSSQQADKQIAPGFSWVCT